MPKMSPMCVVDPSDPDERACAIDPGARCRRRRSAVDSLARRTLPLYAKADFEADLVLRHLAVLHAAPNLANLKPLDVAQGCSRACDGGLDGLGHRLLGTADEIGLPVNVVVLHRSSPW